MNAALTATQDARDAADGDVVRRILAGDREAFALLVRRHQAALYRHVRGMGLDHEAAQDLVQEAFVKAFVRLKQCRDPDRFLAWLYRITRNTVLDWLKDIRRRELPIEAAADLPSVDRSIERQELRDSLVGAMRGLPGILREAFLLRHHHDYSYEEIAEMTGVSLSAAKMRVHRARESLRETLDAFDPDVTRQAAHSS